MKVGNASTSFNVSERDADAALREHSKATGSTASASVLDSIKTSHNHSLFFH